MKKTTTKKMKLMVEDGFTMIELMIVIAIMGVLSAALIPTFSTMTQKARLKADLTTVKQVQSLIDIYMVENDGLYPGKIDITDVKYEGTLPTEAVAALVGGDYIKQRDTDENGAIKLQTADAEAIYMKIKDSLVLDISKTNKKTKKSVEALNEEEMEWIKNDHEETGAGENDKEGEDPEE